VPEQEIDVREAISARPEEVFALLDDSSSWAAWTPIDSTR